MSPRTYRMDVRRAASAATRRKIVDASIRLHAARGTTATSWDDIAEVAEVSRATVYHHFPSLEELIPACAQVAFDLAEVPSLEQAAKGFEDLRRPRDRVAKLARETCKCYAAGAGWLRAAWRERDLVPEMGGAVARLQKARDVLIEAAVGSSRTNRVRRGTLAALLDFPFWDSLDREGLQHTHIADQIEMLALQIVDQGRQG
jgi:AcrR family transcriptional regulator